MIKLVVNVNNQNVLNYIVNVFKMELCVQLIVNVKLVVIMSNIQLLEIRLCKNLKKLIHLLLNLNIRNLIREIFNYTLEVVIVRIVNVLKITVNVTWAKLAVQCFANVLIVKIKNHK